MNKYKKIYINGRFLTTPIAGINRFAYELCKILSDFINLTIIVPKSQLYPEYDISTLNIIEFGNFKSHLWEQIDLPLFLLNKKNYLLLNFSGLGPILCKSKISTIHDVSFLHHPQWFSREYYLFYRILTPLIIKTSRAILTVSEFSKSEILKYYKPNPSKLHVIYNAVTKMPVNNISVDNHEKYILTVGSLDPRKNFKTLIQAFSNDELKHVELRIVGASNKVFGELGYNVQDFPNVKFLGRISEEELKTQYYNALLFILPSLYEGFGIPPLEALYSGCDIAISDIPVFREIFGNAAIYFNPNDAKDISAKIAKYLRGEIKIKQVEKTKVQNKYSWEFSAHKILSLISNI